MNKFDKPSSLTDSSIATEVSPSENFLTLQPHREMPNLVNRKRATTKGIQEYQKGLIWFAWTMDRWMGGWAGMMVMIDSAIIITSVCCLAGNFP